MASSSIVEIPANQQIPIDLTMTKRIPGVTRGKLRVTDAHGNLVYQLDGRSALSSPYKYKKILVDSFGNPQISIVQNKDGGAWQGFRGDSCEKKDLIFRLERTVHSRTRTELEVLLVGQNWGDTPAMFKAQGSPFHRSCTVYKGDSIVAQTSAMYKLGKSIVGRHKFRVTIYPGNDHALVVAVLVIFFGGS
ncbi:protein LURP-one-related 7 [Magnolia sinica]|uniref:protein LURP-one-related 7 n=1 Tax=Magnolia sinica TaxID=86752 RepID=UPI00265B3B08|nr:protein LURP-one-related 7 [Magnolia sinica]